MFNALPHFAIDPPLRNRHDANSDKPCQPHDLCMRMKGRHNYNGHGSRLVGGGFSLFWPGVMNLLGFLPKLKKVEKEMGKVTGRMKRYPGIGH